MSKDEKYVVFEAYYEGGNYSNEAKEYLVLSQHVYNKINEDLIDTEFYFGELEGKHSEAFGEVSIKEDLTKEEVYKILEDNEDMVIYGDVEYSREKIFMDLFEEEFSVLNEGEDDDYDLKQDDGTLLSDIITENSDKIWEEYLEYKNGFETLEIKVKKEDVEKLKEIILNNFKEEVEIKSKGS